MLLILLIAAGTILETLFIMESYKRRSVRSILFKALASVCFVLLCMQCIRIRGQSEYAVLVFWGLVCGLLGDVLLALRFLWRRLHNLFLIAGTLAFFAGHIVYILAILNLSPGAWQYAIPVSLIALGVAGFYSNANKVNAGKILPLGVVRTVRRASDLQPCAVPVFHRRALLLPERQHAGRTVVWEK